MNADNTEYDAILGQQLSEALRAEAESVQVPPDAWSRFQERDRSEDGVILDAIPLDAQPVSITRPPNARHHPWRVPLIAAAAVIAVAVATSAIATNGFQGRTDAGPAAGISGSLNPAAHVTVPLDDSPEIAAVVDGKGQAAPASSILNQSAVSATAGAPPAVQMWFDGTPPEGKLASQFHFPAGYVDDFVKGGTTESDGGAIGYLSFASAEPHGSSYLWGAVGATVSQLQVVATMPRPAGAGPEATSGSATWVIDSGMGNHALFPSAAAASEWTDMPYGYHAFALKLPAGSSSALIYAVGANDDPLQTMRLDLATGAKTDLILPKASASASSSPADAVTSTATAAPPISTTVIGLPDAPRSSVALPSLEILPGGNDPSAPFVATYPDHAVPGGDSALLGGTVHVVDGCVAVMRTDGSAVTPIFPFTRVGTAKAPTVLVFNGKSYADGDAIDLTGGHPAGFQGLPSRCPAATFVVASQ